MWRRFKLIVAMFLFLLCIKNTKASKKSTRTAQRFSTDFANTWAILKNLQTITSAQWSAFETITAAQLTSMALVSAIQYADIASMNVGFIASLTQMAHQTSSNANITNGNGNLSTADANAINGAINALNTLQSHLQGGNYES